MTKTRHSPRLDDRAALLVFLLSDRHGLTISEDIARQDISAHLDHVARLMRIGRQAAKFYVTDDTISTTADRIAAAVAEHQDAPAAVTEARQRRRGRRRAPRRRRPHRRTPPPPLTPWIP